ncbi:hypothetical protein JCM11251_002295 [Rhodosporidiobolus azoricus]
MSQVPSSKRESGWTSWCGDEAGGRTETEGSGAGKLLEPSARLQSAGRGSTSSGIATSGFIAGESGGGEYSTPARSALAVPPALPPIPTTYPLNSSPLEPLVSAAGKRSSREPSFSTATLLASTSTFAHDYHPAFPAYQHDSASASEAVAQPARDRLRLATTFGQQSVPRNGDHSSFGPTFQPSSRHFPGLFLSSSDAGEILPSDYPPSFTSATFLDEANCHCSCSSIGSAPFSPDLVPFASNLDPSVRDEPAAPLSSFFSLPPSQKKGATLSRPETEVASSCGSNDGHGRSNSAVSSTQPDKLVREEKDRIALLVATSMVRTSGGKQGITNKAVPIKPPPARAATASPPASDPPSRGLNASSAPFVPSLQSTTTLSTLKPTTAREEKTFRAEGDFTFSPFSAAFSPGSPLATSVTTLHQKPSNNSFGSNDSGDDAFTTPPGSPIFEALAVEGEGKKSHEGVVTKMIEWSDGGESEWEDESGWMEEAADTEGKREEESRKKEDEAAPPASSAETSFASAIDTAGAESGHPIPPQTPYEGTPYEANGSHDDGKGRAMASPASPSFPCDPQLGGGRPPYSAVSGLLGAGVEAGGEEGEPPAKKVRVEKAEVGEVQSKTSPAFSQFLHASFATSSGSQRFPSPARLSTASSASTTIGTASFQQPAYGSSPPFSRMSAPLSPIASSYSPRSFMAGAQESFPMPFYPSLSSGSTISHMPSSSNPLLALTPAHVPFTSALTINDPLAALLEATRQNGVERHRALKYKSLAVEKDEVIRTQMEEIERLSQEIEEWSRRFGVSEARRADLAKTAGGTVWQRGLAGLDRLEQEYRKAMANARKAMADAAQAKAELRKLKAQLRPLQEELEKVWRDHASQKVNVDMAEKQAREWREEKVALEKAWSEKFATSVAAAWQDANKPKADSEAHLQQDVEAARMEEREAAEKGWVDRVKELKEEVEALKQAGANKVQAEVEKKLKEYKAEKDAALTNVRRELDQAKANVVFLTNSKTALRVEKNETEKRLQEAHEKEEEANEALAAAKRRGRGSEGDLSKSREDRVKEKNAVDAEVSVHREAIRNIVTLEDAFAASHARVGTLDNELNSLVALVREIMDAYLCEREAWKAEADEERGWRGEKEKQLIDFREMVKEVLKRKENEVASLKTDLTAAHASASSARSQQDELNNLALRLKVAEAGSSGLHKELEAAKVARRAATLALEVKEKKVAELERAQGGLEGLFKIRQGKWESDMREKEAEWEKAMAAQRDIEAKLAAQLHDTDAKLHRLTFESQDLLDDLMKENQALKDSAAGWKRRAEEAEKEREERATRARSTGTLAFLAAARSPAASAAGSVGGGRS